MKRRIIAFTLSVAFIGMLWSMAQSVRSFSEPYPNERSFEQRERADAVGQRITASRSFFGAPPPVPHDILSERDSSYCLQCHALKNRIRKRHQAIAPVPHAEYSQCTQCHVRGTATTETLFRENSFVGLDLPGKGSQANRWAPPTIPHKTFMRENCLSCHGPTGDFSIKTAHPVRSQCQQCHVPEASVDYTRP